MESVHPRVKMVSDEEVQGDAKAIFEKMNESSGKVPKWMRVMANNSDVMVGFFTLFKATMDDAPVESKLKWKIAYKVSQMNKCTYCVDVSKSKLEAMGLDEGTLSCLTTECTDREKAALDYAEATAFEAYKMDEKVFENLKAHFNDEEIVELTAVIGLFSYINRFNDALRVLPEVK